MQAARARRPGAMSELTVLIDGRGGHDLSGRLLMAGGTREAAFGSALEMLRAAGAVFDAMAFPQRNFDSRSFGASRRSRSDRGAVDSRMEREGSTAGGAAHEKAATFIVRVRFRRNATWQGEIRWISRGKTQRFRSSLEMITLMDQAVAEEFGGRAETAWQGDPPPKEPETGGDGGPAGGG